MKKMLITVMFIVCGSIFCFGLNSTYAQPVIQAGNAEDAEAYDLNELTSEEFKALVKEAGGEFQVWLDNSEEKSNFNKQLETAYSNEDVFIIYHKKWEYDDGTSYYEIEVLDGSSPEAEERRAKLKKTMQSMMAALSLYNQYQQNIDK